MAEPKRKRTEEQAYVAMLVELQEQGVWLRHFRLKDALIPEDWQKIEEEVPVRPFKSRLTARFDAEVVKWYRRMGHGYQARMNAVLKTYTLAVISKEIRLRKDLDWKYEPL